MRIQNSLLYKKLDTIWPDLIVSIICIVSFIFSIIESRVNVDAHHWGLMYANAIDIARGAIPFKEIFIQYGVLTTLIQGFALLISDNKSLAIGIVTGVFYSANFYLSYRLWQRILSKRFACLSTVLMFLLQGYIIYPWSNYFSYTFLLICLLVLTEASITRKPIYYGLAGVFFAGNVLARQTALSSTLLPIYLYFLLDYWRASEENNRLSLRNILWFHTGFGLVFGIFLIYLLKVSALHDWYLQNFKILSMYQNYFGGNQRVIKRFLRAITSFSIKELRMFFYTINFWISLYWVLRSIIGVLNKKGFSLKNEHKIVFLFAGISVFGYLQSLHIYEIFRLQNSSSIGLGLIVYSVLKITSKLPKFVYYINLIFLVAILINLSVTFLGRSSIYYPWNYKALLTNQLQQPDRVPMFAGKLFNSETRNYYDSLVKAIEPYQSKVKYIVNLSYDSYFLYLSDAFQKVQVAPYYSPELAEKILPGEKERIERIIHAEDAVYFARSRSPVIADDRYCIIAEIDQPKNIPFMFDKNYKVYIFAPKKFADKCL
jgi:hypothetical protein